EEGVEAPFVLRVRSTAHGSVRSALRRPARRRCRVHRISTRVRDDRDPPLVSAKSARMCERAVLAKPPVAGTEPVTPQRRQSLSSEQGTAPVVFLNPNSCKGFEPEPSKEGSRRWHKTIPLSSVLTWPKTRWMPAFADSHCVKCSRTPHKVIASWLPG